MKYDQKLKEWKFNMKSIVDRAILQGSRETKETHPILLSHLDTKKS